MKAIHTSVERAGSIITRYTTFNIFRVDSIQNLAICKEKLL